MQQYDPPSHRLGRPPRARRRTAHVVARRVLGLVALAASIVLPATVLAQARPTVRLEYVRGPHTGDCPAPGQLRAALATRLGRDAVVADARTAIEVAVTRDARGVRAHIQTRDASGRAVGSHTLGPTTGPCTDLVDALTLALAIAIDPVASMRALMLPPPPVQPRASATTGSSASGPAGTSAPPASPPRALAAHPPAVSSALPRAPLPATPPTLVHVPAGSGAPATPAVSVPATRGGSIAVSSRPARRTLAPRPRRVVARLPVLAVRVAPGERPVPPLQLDALIVSAAPTRESPAAPPHFSELAPIALTPARASSPAPAVLALRVARRATVTPLARPRAAPAATPRAITRARPAQRPAPRRAALALGDLPPVRLRMGLGGAITTDLAGVLRAGATATVALRWRALSVGLEARRDQPLDPSTAGAAASWQGALFACAHHAVGPTDIAGCALAVAGFAQGSAGDEQHDATGGAFGGGGARVAWELPLGTTGMRVRVHADLLATSAPRAATSAVPVATGAGITLLYDLP